MINEILRWIIRMEVRYIILMYAFLMILLLELTHTYSLNNKIYDVKKEHSFERDHGNVACKVDGRRAG